MNFKKSMVSVAAAAVLAVGFIGCGDTEGSNSTSNDTSTAVTDASNGTQHINTPKGTVTGFVQDTNGNPLKGVTVYIADKTTTTNDGGRYTFTDVPVTTTAGTDGANANTVLSVTIAAPTGYLGATVTVTPGAQIDSAEDGAAGGGTTSGSETFIDGYLAQAGTAVLPHLGVTVKGKLELISSEAVVANQEITLDFLKVNTGANVSQVQDTVSTSYSTGNYTTVTDASGYFTFTNIPADAELKYVVPNYVVDGEQVTSDGNKSTVLTNDETSLVNVGDIQVHPVVNNDTIHPMIKSVTGQLDLNSTATKVSGNAPFAMMLEDDVRTSVTVNFTEPIDTLSENDEDFSRSVTVYDWTNGVYITPTSIAISGSSVTVNLPNALTDAQEFDINFLIADFKDAAGNVLQDTNTSVAVGNIDTNIAPSVSGQAIRVSLMAFKEVNTNANSATAHSQLDKDTVGSASSTDASNFDTLRAYSNAFNDVALPHDNIQQLNSTEAGIKLKELAVKQGFTTADINTSAARITFTPSGAASYLITRTAKNSTTAINVNIDTTSLVNVKSSNITDNNTAAVKVVTTDNVNPVELVLDGALDDVIKITPQDDDGYKGTPVTITLADKVAPTTMLQKSYMGNRGTNSASVVKVFGNGGELSNPYSVAATAGTPILAVTPGLLDNLVLSGTTVVDIQADGLTTQIASDNNLVEELYAYNTPTTITTDAADVLNIAKTDGIYDTAAYTHFIANLTRKVGVAFDEDIDINGVVLPTPSATTIVAGSFKAINDVLVDDDNVAIDGNTTTGDKNVDLVEFSTSNVIELANNNNNVVLSFDGIKDDKGNVADNADVVLQDYMPPFVTTAKYDGDMTFTFNEAITAPTDTDPVELNITNAAASEFKLVELNASNQTNGSITGWALSSDKKTLTVYSSIVGETNSSNKVSTLFNKASYIESSYASTAKNHAVLDFRDVKDASTQKNSWAVWETLDIQDGQADMVTPKFAMIDMIGAFGVSLDTDNVVNFTAAQLNANPAVVTTSIKWTFNHPIANFATYEYNSTSNKFVVAGGAESTGTAEYALTTGVDQFFAFAKAAGADVNITLNNTPVITIAGDRKAATLTFKDMNDTSNFNGTNAVAGDSLNLRSDYNVSSSLTDEVTPTKVGATVK